MYTIREHVKHISTQANSGLMRWEGDKDLHQRVLDFLASRGKGTEAIRKYTARPDGTFRFSTGSGYAIFDMDLLGGNADGQAEKEFDALQNE